jgi:1,4-dihydroxy-2-naphthoyl-CoA hydrolase
MTPFTTTTRIRLSRTDAAGVVFFPQALVMAHEAYEQFMDDHGCAVTTLLAASWAIPVVQASVSWLSPLRLGDDVIIALHSTHVGTTSFALAYTLTCKDVVAARCDTTHVCLQHGTKTPIPVGLKEALIQVASANQGGH